MENEIMFNLSWEWRANGDLTTGNRQLPVSAMDFVFGPDGDQFFDSYFGCQLEYAE